MLLGLYGGTFNPVHRGHVHAALTVCRTLGLEEVRMILSARPGHRHHPQVTPAHRWRMLELACAAHPELVPDDTELKRSGASYTVRTLEGLHAARPGLVACWILGQDSFATLPSWFQWERVLDLANLIVLERPGHVAPEPEVLARLCDEHETRELDTAREGQIVRLEAPMLEISSTQIRAALREGRSVAGLLAASVYTYIRDHHLYRDAEKAI